MLMAGFFLPPQQESTFTQKFMAGVSLPPQPHLPAAPLWDLPVPHDWHSPTMCKDLESEYTPGSHRLCPKCPSAGAGHIWNVRSSTYVALYTHNPIWVHVTVSAT